MRILVTGGAGYIGSHTVKLLVARGHDVRVLDNLALGHRAAVPAERLTVADLADTPAVDHLLLTHRIEAVVHFAAFAAVGESVKHPARYWRNNLVNTLGLLDLCRRHGVNRFVFSSTCATYGVPEKVPMAEDTPQRPINPYGQSKLAVERALADYAAAYGLGYAALRYFNAAGAAADGTIGEDHHPESHLIPLVLQVALGQRESVDVFGTDYPTPDGTCVRDYIHVSDLTRAHLDALRYLRAGGKSEVLNCGYGRGFSVLDVISAVKRAANSDFAVYAGPRRAGDPAALVAGAGRIREVLGWEPRRGDLDTIVGDALSWEKRLTEVRAAS
jgi:UDP-glucose 4-epimerase